MRSVRRAAHLSSRSDVGHALSSAYLSSSASRIGCRLQATRRRSPTLPGVHPLGPASGRPRSAEHDEIIAYLDRARPIACAPVTQAITTTARGAIAPRAPLHRTVTDGAQPRTPA